MHFALLYTRYRARIRKIKDKRFLFFIFSIFEHWSRARIERVGDLLMRKLDISVRTVAHFLLPCLPKIFANESTSKKIAIFFYRTHTTGIAQSRFLILNRQRSQIGERKKISLGELHPNCLGIEARQINLQ